MPYDAHADLPQSVRDHLPDHAQRIYREAFNHAWVQYARDPAHEEIAHRVAWSALNESTARPATAESQRADNEGERR